MWWSERVGWIELAWRAYASVLSLLALYKLCFVQVVESIRHDRKSCLNL
jgi:hypothetical protein